MGMFIPKDRTYFNEPLVICDYDPKWPTLFLEEKQRIQQHVGSTGIPGMTAKPIIDIQVVVINFNNLRSCVTGLRSLRYAYKGECNIAGREYFKKPGYHIHMMQINNAEYTRKKLFVQYLRDNEDAHIEYVNLKRQLANKWAGHREGQYKYTSDKTDFIMGILRKAGWQQ